MNTIGQTINILSVTAFLAAAALCALGKLSVRLFFTAAIAINMVGLVGSQIGGSVWGSALHVIAIGCFVAALAAHRMRTP